MLVIALAVAVLVILLVSGSVTGGGRATVSSAGPTPGGTFPDQGDGPARSGFRYDSSPPTSGPHAHVPVRTDETPLSDDQLLTALALGDVVIEYGTARPPSGLSALAVRLAGPFSPTLAADGQAVILAPGPGVSGLIALAWTRMARMSEPSDPLLRAFILTWLGRGAR